MILLHRQDVTWQEHLSWITVCISFSSKLRGQTLILNKMFKGWGEGMRGRGGKQCRQRERDRERHRERQCRGKVVGHGRGQCWGKDEGHGQRQ